MFSNLLKTSLIIMGSFFISDIYSMDFTEEDFTEESSADLCISAKYTENVVQVDFYNREEKEPITTIKCRDEKLFPKTFEFEIEPNLKIRGAKSDKFEGWECFVNSIILPVWNFTFDILTKDSQIVIAPDVTPIPIKGVFVFETNKHIVIQNQITFEKLIIKSETTTGFDKLMGNIIRIPLTPVTGYSSLSQTSQDVSLSDPIIVDEKEDVITSSSSASSESSDSILLTQQQEENESVKKQGNEDTSVSDINSEVTQQTEKERVGKDGARDALHEIEKGKVTEGIGHLVRAAARSGEVKKWKKRLGF